jgi:LPS O-antigen subunit length determinant protein (WzzB/FepE family)
MKNNSSLHNDEIDLIALSKIIWDGKIKILIITIISFLLGFGYNSQIPNNYINSLSIYPSKDYKLAWYDLMVKLVNSNQTNQLAQSNQSNQSNQLNELIQKQFMDEFKDYEEFLVSIKNSKKIQEQFSKLEIKDQEIKLFKNTKFIEIVEPVKNKVNYIINLKWHDPDEAKIILKDTLNLVSKNFKKSIELKLLQSVEFKKKLLLHKNRERLNFLNEQSAIAKELDIIDNQIDSVNLSQSNVSLNISTVDNAYYLRGYKAIDKEIELIKNRESLDFIDQELNEFKEVEIKFVDYNIYLMNTKSLKNTKLILMISILLGLIAGVFYVLILNVFQFQTVSKKIK